jgi:hypothetical protein
MPISFKCDACGQALKVKDDLANRRVKCPKCAQPVQVPAAPQAAAIPADPEIRIVEENSTSPDPSPAPVGPRAGARAGSSPRKPILTPPESETPYILRGLVGGLLAAVLGAFVWYLLAKGINAKIGYVAWGIGWATGFGVFVLSGGKGGAALPFLGAGTALFGWLLGEYMIYTWTFQDMMQAELLKQAG